MCTEIRTVNRRASRSGSQAGLSLIELVMFIVIVGIGVAGILSVLNLTAQKSADPMIRKQMLAAAESLLEEVELMPFTYCDPDDPAVLTALNPAGCVTAEGTTTIPASEGRGTATPFDNVGDYGGTTGTLTISPLTDVSNSSIGMLGGYSATVNVATSTLGGIAAADSLLITVTVTASTGESLALSGYRTRYAPNATQ